MTIPKVFLSIAAIALGAHLAAQPVIIPPTCGTHSLKGPVRAVQTLALLYYDDDTGYDFCETTSEQFDKSGRLCYSINSTSDGMSDVTTYKYDSHGRLSRVGFNSTEVYQYLYHYAPSGQLDSIVARFFNEGMAQFNHTLVVKKHDNQCRPLRIESTPDADNLVQTYVFSYRNGGTTVAYKSNQINDTVNYYYYNRDGILDSTLYFNKKTIYIYNPKGQLMEEQYYGYPSSQQALVITYEYPSEPYLTDKYGNWLTRYVTMYNGDKRVEQRTILYYED